MSLRDELERSFPLAGTEWLAEAEALARRLAPDVSLARTFDHALLVGARFLEMAGPLEALGYAIGSDETLYLGEVEGLRYLGIAATLAPDAPARARGWFDHILLSQPAHQPAYDYLQHGYQGGLVLHHVALAVHDPAREGESELDYALRAIPRFLRVQARVSELTGAPPQKLTLSLPAAVLASERFEAAFAAWTRGSAPAAVTREAMLGGGFLCQFASTDSYRVEVVLRHGTTRGFNPVAQTKLSRDVAYRG